MCCSKVKSGITGSESLRTAVKNGVVARVSQVGRCEEMKCDRRERGDCRGLPGGADKSRTGERGGRGGRTAVVITAGTVGARAVPAPLHSCVTHVTFTIMLSDEEGFLEAFCVFFF